MTTDQSPSSKVPKSVVSPSPSPRGRAIIASCRSGTYMARQVLAEYRMLQQERQQLTDVTFLPDLDSQFSDSETTVRLEEDVSGNDVFLFQALYDPTAARSIDENYMAFFIAVRAFREWGANHVTAVLPYLAYARQDKPAPFKREPTTAKLTADLAITAGIDRLITWHPHLRQIHGFYGGTPVHAVDAVGLWVEAFRRFAGRQDVIVVSPDAGAAKFVTLVSRELDLPTAIGSKYRPRPEEAVLTEIIGDTTKKEVAIILDDMISSGGTMDALVRMLVEEGNIREVYMAASHNLCLPIARERLQELRENYYLKELIVTNTIPQTEAFQTLPYLSVKNLAPTLARIVYRIHYHEPVTALFYRMDHEEEEWKYSKP